MNKKFDLRVLRQQYISSDVSIRELARQVEGAESSLRRWAKIQKWDEAREDYRTRVQAHESEALAEQDARQLIQTRSSLLHALDEGIERFRADLKRTKLVEDPDNPGEKMAVPVVTVHVRDLAMLARELNVLSGRPTDITEGRNLSLSAHAEVSDELLIRLANLGRERGTDGGTVGSSPLDRLEAVGAGETIP